MPWSIVCRPDQPYERPPAKEGEDGGGSTMRILLREYNYEKEVCRVGFDRRVTKHPDELYKDVFDRCVTRAQECVRVLNDMIAPPGEVW